MTRSMFSLLLLLTPFVAGTTVGPAAGATDADGEEEILIYSKPFAGVYYKNHEGSNRIIFRHGPRLAPRLSPDGEQLLINSARGGKWGVWIGKQDGSQMARICDGDQAEWAPQSDHIVFRRDGVIIERHLSAGTERQLSPPGRTDCRFPSYQSSQSVIFVTGDGPASRVVVVDRQDAAVSRVVLEARIASAPRCSPDGKTLAYPDGAHIHLMDLETGHRHQLTAAGGVQSWPRWSSDGKALAFCHAPNDQGPWEVHCLEIDRPAMLRIIQRGVDPAPDFRGSPATSGLTVQLKAMRLSVWTRENPQESLDLSRISWPQESQEGWEPMAYVAEGVALHEPALVENEWHRVLVVPETGVLAVFPKFQNQDAEAVTVALATEGAYAGPYACTVSRHDQEKFRVEISGNTETGSPVKVTCEVSRASPYVQLTPGPNVRDLVISNPSPYVLIPDRIANDLLIEAGNHTGPEVRLPSSPYLLATSTGGRGVLILATPNSKQDVRLSPSEGIFTHLRVRPAGDPVFVSLLPAHTFFHNLTDLIANEGPSDDIQWPAPSEGQWRASFFGARNHSTNLSRRDSDGEMLLHLDEASHPVKFAAAYLAGRTSKTPLDVITSEDIIRDTRGSLRSYTEGTDRHRLPESGWRDQRLNHTDLSPTLDLLGHTPTEGGLYMGNTEGLRTLVSHLCDDVVDILRQLDERISEYEESISRLQEACASESTDASAATGFLTEIGQSIQALKTQLADVRPESLATVEAGSDQIKSLLGSGKWLSRTKEYKQFRAASSSALAQRQHVLAALRDFMITLSERSGYAVVQEPRLKPVADDFRRTVRGLLESRYPLEGK